MPERVRITDVAPRDGLQNEPGTIPTPEKIRLVGLLARTGVDEVEVSSLVSPRWVPQLADAEAVFGGVAELRTRNSELDPGIPRLKSGISDLRSQTPDTQAPSIPNPKSRIPDPDSRIPDPESRPLFSALVPNEQGMLALLGVNDRARRERGIERLIGKAAVFTAASETFSVKNTNASIDQTLERFAPVLGLAKEHGIAVRGYVSCAIACPFEGAIEAGEVVRVAERLLGLGVDEIDLGDTIGAGTPDTVARLLDVFRAHFGAGLFAADRLTLHLHDTFGTAADCVRTALDIGVRSFDGSAAGLGGCPYASTADRRAPGNIATETLVRTIHGAGFETGVDLGALAEASACAARIASGASTGGGA